MKVLITGAAGYIGSNLSEYLLGRDYEVVGLDNFNDFYDPKIKEYNIKDFKDNEKFTLHKEDILNKNGVESIFSEESFDAVVHLAAWAGVAPSVEFPDVYVRNNVEGTVILAEAAIKNGVPNFVFASTSSVYGNINKTPYKEEMNTDHPLGPYPATKKACEVMLSTYNKNYGLNVTNFRIFNPIGIRLRPDLLLPKLIRSCLYGYECPIYWTKEERDEIKRDYAYLGSMMEAIEFVLENPFEFEIFNLGNSEPISLNEIIGAVEKATGTSTKTKEVPHRGGEMFVTYANVDKAKKMLGYNPNKSVEEMVKIYYDWFLDQEDWYKKGEF
jgi:UDP-glucuronate 4-epimerase